MNRVRASPHFIHVLYIERQPIDFTNNSPYYQTRNPFMRNINNDQSDDETMGNN